MRLRDLTKLTNEHWINLFSVHYDNAGHSGRWVFASRRERPHEDELKNDAVLMVPLLRNPGEEVRLVLIKEFRVPVGRHVLGLPAGLLDPGEAVEQTVRREMWEETGLEVTCIQRISPPLLSSSGLTDESAALAFVEVKGNPADRGPLDGNEDIEVLLVDYAGVCALVEDPGLWIDARAWMVLHMFQKLGRLD